MKKFLNVPLLEFLQKIVNENTQSYSQDFELDKEIFIDVAAGRGLQGNVWLWISRQHGTQCVSEQEVFVKGSPAYSTWNYFDNDFVGENIKAYAVEVGNVNDGVVYGNVYELDYKAHVAEVKRCAVAALEVHKVFEDGYVDRVAPERSCYGYYTGLVAQHGAIVDSLWAPVNESELMNVLCVQKRARDSLSVGQFKSNVASSNQVESLIAEAAARSKATGDKENTMKDYIKE